MRIKIGLLGLMLTGIGSSLGKNFSDISPVSTFIYHDFDEAMQTTNYLKSIAITKHIVGIDGKELRIFFKSLYDANNPLIIPLSQTLKIPKIMHFVWLGSPFPDAFREYVLSWAKIHEGHGWKIKIWTDEDLKDFKLINQVLYDETDSYGVKSDLLKWEIVYRYGGVYLDVDFEGYKLLDELHYTYDFYTAIQPLDTQYLQLGAAAFAARPGHPILKHCIDTIKDDWNKKGAPAKSGPIHFTRSFFATAGKTPGSIDIAFPALYFYPLGCTEKTLHKDEWLAQGAWGVHMWAKSWMPASYRPHEFKKLFNDHLVKTWND